MRKKQNLITFSWAMATGGCSLASLKRKLDDLTKQIFEIDLKIQEFKKEAIRLLQQEIVSTQIKFELQKVKNKKKN